MFRKIPDNIRLEFITHKVKELYEECFVDLYDDTIPYSDAFDVVPFQIEGSGDGFGDEITGVFFNEDSDTDDFFEEFAFAKLSDIPKIINRFWDGVVHSDVDES